MILEGEISTEFLCEGKSHPSQPGTVPLTSGGWLFTLEAGDRALQGLAPLTSGTLVCEAGGSSEQTTVLDSRRGS